MIAWAFVSLSFGLKFQLYHLNIPSLHELVILLESVGSDFPMSENIQATLSFHIFPKTFSAKTEKNLDACSLVIVSFGKKSVTVALEVSPALYIQLTAVLSSSGLIVIAVAGGTIVQTLFPSMITKASIIFLPGFATYSPL